MGSLFGRIKEQLKSTVDHVAGELSAQRHYDRARKLLQEGLDRAVAREIVAELEPTVHVDSNFKACVHYLLAQAYPVLGEPDRALEHLEKALEYLYDPTERHYHERRIAEDFGMPVEDLMGEIHAEMAHHYFRQGQFRKAIHHAQEATQLNRFNLTAYYFWGASLLRLGLPPQEAFEVFMRALPLDKGGIVEGWVEELLPDYLERVRLMRR
jgi:tetratricopeptide (TPR) repeat protein